MKLGCKSKQKSVVEFWPGNSAEIDIDLLARRALPVKGVGCDRPLRFLEIYTNTSSTSCSRNNGMPWQRVRNTFLPRIGGRPVVLHPKITQPPFSWRSASPDQLAVSFTYNTNALHRILSRLAKDGLIANHEAPKYLDEACLLLGNIYRSGDYFLIRNINNNLNMHLISKVVELIVGRGRYNAELQELETTQRALDEALASADAHRHLPTLEKMALAIGSGVAFAESKMRNGQLDSVGRNEVELCSHRYYSKSLAIDHRTKLLAMIESAGLSKGSFTLAVIVDDTTETIADLLWLQDIVEIYPFCSINLLVNTAQISINYSAHLLLKTFNAPCFKGLRLRLNQQVKITPVHCPLISFQTNYLPIKARRAIQKVDAVYIKGANYFETCQLQEKETFHAFVVFGPISRLYTGLHDYDAVFAHLPAGVTGYAHAREPHDIQTLADVLRKSPL